MTVYLQAINREDWSTVVDMMYPKIFELVTTQQMIEVMSGLGMKMRIEQLEENRYR